MTATVVIFTAPCPSCGTESRWTQTGDACKVTAADFRVDCDRCPAGS